MCVSVHARVNQSVVRASTSYSCSAMALFSPLSLSFLPAPPHLFICRHLTVLIIALALAQHVLPKQDTEMEFEKKGECVLEIVNEQREEDANRGMKSGRKDGKKGGSKERKQQQDKNNTPQNKDEAVLGSEGDCSVIKCT